LSNNMPPKQKKANNENEEAEEPFQAVILTDSFEDQFLPISHEMPRVSKLHVHNFVLNPSLTCFFYFPCSVSCHFAIFH
jgi:hypothetical protein